jgi:prepilin-type N-terminal cleavage/methylation domain-containing protein
LSGATGRAGFTLLELLVVAALMGLIGVAASGGLRFGARAWERESATEAAQMEAAALRRFLADALASAAPVRLRDGSREPPALFAGGPERVVFAGALPSHLAPGGAQLMELALGPDGTLTLRWEPLGDRRPGSRPGPDARRETLARDLVSGRFLYEGEPRWTGLPAPPRLVTVELTWEDGPAWPALVVAPHRASAP